MVSVRNIRIWSKTLVKSKMVQLLKILKEELKRKKKYESQYSDAEPAAMDSTSESSKNTTEQIEEIKNRIHNQQKKDESLSSSDLSEDERKASLNFVKPWKKPKRRRKTLPQRK